MTKSILLAFIFVSGLGCGTASEVYTFDCSDKESAETSNTLGGGDRYLIASGIERSAVTSISTISDTGKKTQEMNNNTFIDDEGGLWAEEGSCNVSDAVIIVTLRYD